MKVKRKHGGRVQGRSGSVEARERRNVKLEERINYGMRSNNAGISMFNERSNKLVQDKHDERLKL